MLYRLVLVSALSGLVPLVECFVSIPWQTEVYYGHDGPWQAVTVNIGGFMNGTPPSSQWSEMDLLPGGGWSQYVISSQYCSNISSWAGADTCTIDNGWNPGSMQTQDGSVIQWPGTMDYQTKFGPYMTGSIYAQNLDVSWQGTSSTIQNSSSVAVTQGNITMPNGQAIPLQVGYLALGSPAPMQVFSLSSTNANVPAITTWTMPGQLYNQSKIKSFSYGLHIGSAALNYTGSLVFGGYDQGRAIGPATTFGNNSPQLLDVIIDVATGASPFSFGSQAGLLLGPSGQASSLPVDIDPVATYIHLPKQTCDKLATLLPIQFDQTTGYYLWNINDPLYKVVTSSPAYLGFIFPPAVGATANVTIKVPFALLNLQLSQPVVANRSIAYFPCMPYSPPSGQSYSLGRAFLQAAFIGRNWNQQTSWLAQAPGPGASGQGLGSAVTDIEDGATTIQLYDDNGLFNMSWAGTWTPLVKTADGNITAATPSNNNQTASATSSSSSSTGLSTGVKAGIAIGAVLGIAIILAALLFLFCRRRRAKSAVNKHGQPFYNVTAASPSNDDSYVRDKPGQLSELQAQSMMLELPSHREPTELDSQPASRHGSLRTGSMRSTQVSAATPSARAPPSSFAGTFMSSPLFNPTHQDAGSHAPQVGDSQASSHGPAVPVAPSTTH